MEPSSPLRRSLCFRRSCPAPTCQECNKDFRLLVSANSGPVLSILSRTSFFRCSCPSAGSQPAPLMVALRMLRNRVVSCLPPRTADSEESPGSTAAHSAPVAFRAAPPFSPTISANDNSPTRRPNFLRDSSTWMTQNHPNLNVPQIPTILSQISSQILVTVT